MTFSQALVAKAKEAKSAEELLALAKEHGIELTSEEAEKYYTDLHPVTGELSDEELENASGGGGCGEKDNGIDEYYYRVGDRVQFDTGDRVMRMGKIEWKGYVTSQNAIIYRIKPMSSDGVQYYDVRLQNLWGIYSRNGREYEVTL